MNPCLSRMWHWHCPHPLQFYAKAVNADSLTVWDYSVEVASLLIEFGLQFTLRESFVMDFGKKKG